MHVWLSTMSVLLLQRSTENSWTLKENPYIDYYISINTRPSMTLSPFRYQALHKNKAKHIKDPTREEGVLERGHEFLRVAARRFQKNGRLPPVFLCRWMQLSQGRHLTTPLSTEHFYAHSPGNELLKRDDHMAWAKIRSWRRTPSKTSPIDIHFGPNLWLHFKELLVFIRIRVLHFTNFT